MNIGIILLLSIIWIPCGLWASNIMYKDKKRAFPNRVKETLQEEMKSDLIDYFVVIVSGIASLIITKPILYILNKYEKDSN